VRAQPWFRPNLFESAYLIVRLKKIAQQLVRILGTPRGRRSLYDFAVVSLAVWLLGGLAVLVLWGPSEENQTGERLSAEARDTSAQQLPVLRRELHEAEADYQRATLDLNNAAMEHALHRQAVSTFLARHFRDLIAESVPDQQPRSALTIPNPRWLALNRALTTLMSERRELLARVSPAHPRILELEARMTEARTVLDRTPREIPYDESLARDVWEAVTVPKNSSGAGWGPKIQVSYSVTTEGPSATYELPRSAQKSSTPNAGIEEQKRYEDLEAAAQASARLLESAVLGERNAWDRMQEAISVYHAAKDYSTIGERTPNAAAATVSLDADPSIALGLTLVTALSVGAGYVFVRKAQGLPTTGRRAVSDRAELTAQLGLPVLGSVPAPAGLMAESKRQFAALVRCRTRIDNVRFTSESIVGGMLLMCVMLALLQPGFADRFFDQPARAVSEVASWF
jgi:hypothetical protein